jgi:hypothetical protein
MSANTETEQARIILIPVPRDDPSWRNGERSITTKNPKKMMAKLKIRHFLAVLEFQDNPIAPNAASTVMKLTSNWKSAASERAVATSGTNPAYTISRRTSPNETAASQAYTPTTRGPIMPVDEFGALFVSLIGYSEKISPLLLGKPLFLQRIMSAPICQMEPHV